MTASAHDRPDRPRVSRADRRLAQRLARRLSYYALRPTEIEHRLAELDREWPLERRLQGHAAALSIAGLVAGLASDRRLLWLPAVASLVLLQQALRGTSLPRPLYRALGVRSATEIALERYALKALRGDFGAVPQAGAWQPAIERPDSVEPGSPAAAMLRDRAATALEAARR